MTYRKFGCVTAFLFCMHALSFSLSADQTSPELDTLFSKLNTLEPSAANATKAGALQAAIWKIWYETDQEDAGNFMRDGVEAMERGLFKRSIEAFDKAIAADRDFAEAWNRRATVLFLDGKLDRSLADVEKVLELEPRHFGALSGAGQIYMRQDKPELAIKALEQALKVNPHITGLKDQITYLRRQIKDKSI